MLALGARAHQAVPAILQVVIDFNEAEPIFVAAVGSPACIVLAPTIVAGKITLGPMNQILNAFAQVRSSSQYRVHSWPQIIELISIYKSLRSFENRIYGEFGLPMQHRPSEALYATPTGPAVIRKRPAGH